MVSNKLYNVRSYLIPSHSLACVLRGEISLPRISISSLQIIFQPLSEAERTATLYNRNDSSKSRSGSPSSRTFNARVILNCQLLYTSSPILF